MASEEEYQEAVTPSPESSPPPSVSVPETYNLTKQKVLTAVSVGRTVVTRDTVGSNVMSPVDTGVRVEDALLLLSFHNNPHVH